jgi:isoquinoline 1-oxidoreductase subunit beta
MVRSIESATTRREFLIRSAATAAGAFLSIGLPALGSSIAAAQPIAGFTPSIWFTLTPDGKVTMHIVKAEMGQHIGTALAQIIAEELEVKWEDVRLDSPLESVENFAIYGLAYTVNSGSVTTEFDRLSRAGAAGRTALIEAGAQVLGAKESDCTASNSRVTDSASGRSVSYGEIVQKVKIDRKFAYPEDFKAIKLKSSGAHNIIGKSIPALDIPSKVTGQAKYGIDVFLPNMVYARSSYRGRAMAQK